MDKFCDYQIEALAAQALNFSRNINIPALEVRMLKMLEREPKNPPKTPYNIPLQDFFKYLFSEKRREFVLPAILLDNFNYYFTEKLPNLKNYEQVLSRIEAIVTRTHFGLMGKNYDLHYTSIPVSSDFSWWSNKSEDFQPRSLNEVSIGGYSYSELPESLKKLFLVTKYLSKEDAQKLLDTLDNTVHALAVVTQKQNKPNFKPEDVARALGFFINVYDKAELEKD